MKKRKVIKNFF